MTNMEIALKDAGVKLPPLSQRVWQWLKDNGAHSAVDLAVELKVPLPSVRATLTVMVRRKMLSLIKRTDHKGQRIHNHYGALGREYELLPEPAKRGAAGRAAAAEKREEKMLQLHALASSVPAASTPAFSPEQLLANCTLAELRQVHTFLKGMFK